MSDNLTIERSIQSAPVHNETQSRALRPISMQDYIGQEPLTQALNVFIHAAKTRNESLDHVLLFGPPGLGKTTLAQIIAHEMQASIKQTSGPVLEKPGDLAAILSNLSPNDVLFIDEIHRLHPTIEEILYPALEDFKLDLMIGEGPAARSVQIDLPPFTLVGATTRAGNLTAPLRARFGITQRLEFYKAEDLARIIKRSSQHLEFPLEIEAALTLAQHARGTPRIANRLLKRVRDFAQAQGISHVDANCIRSALELIGIDQHGFDALDRKYLNTLCHTFQGGPAGVESIAVSMGESKHTVEDLVEPFLIQSGYVMRTPRGRLASELLKENMHLYCSK